MAEIYMWASGHNHNIKSLFNFGTLLVAHRNYVSLNRKVSSYFIRSKVWFVKNDFWDVFGDS